MLMSNYDIRRLGFIILSSAGFAPVFKMVVKYKFDRTDDDDKGGYVLAVHRGRSGLRS